MRPELDWSVIARRGQASSFLLLSDGRLDGRRERSAPVRKAGYAEQVRARRVQLLRGSFVTWAEARTRAGLGLGLRREGDKAGVPASGWKVANEARRRC